MQVALGKEGSVTLVKLFGPVIAGELDALDTQLMRLEKNWTQRIVLDMAEVPFIDSAGLEMLTHTQRQLSSHGLQLKLSGTTEMTQTILELTKIAQQFQIFPDTSSAVRSFL